MKRPRSKMFGGAYRRLAVLGIFPVLAIVLLTRQMPVGAMVGCLVALGIAMAVTFAKLTSQH